jgi:protease-4
MKQFFKMVLACFVAVVFAGAVSLFFLLVMLGSLAARSDQRPVVADGSILVFDVSANISDAPDENATGALLAEALGNGGPPRLQLRKVIDAIDRAADDPRIKGLLLHGSFEASGLGSGYGALLEVRTALERFRGAGKPVTAYLVTPSTRDYMVASMADRVILHPMGMLVTPGLNSEVIYWGGLFAKYGVGVQIARAGAYKSFGESYSKQSMSEQEREQLTELLDDVWNEFIASVTRSRKLDDGALQKVIDETGLIAAEQAKAAGLVDELRDFSEVLDELRESTGVATTGAAAEAKTFKQISVRSYIAAHAPAPDTKPKGPQVAVIYAEGEIIDGEGAPDIVGGDKLARELRKLRHNDDVKAVVLRVNSPGGSAVASEVIRRELVLLHEKKPVVVSMGSMATSGGYWIATACDRVFAEPTTITGSIGVVAILPNVQGLAERFDVNIESVKTARHADVFSIAKPRDEETMKVMQGFVEDSYEKFITRVSESRKMSREDIEKIAGGRVWSGADALRLGLVDEIGGLDRAITHAASVAKLTNYTVVDAPEPEDYIARLFERLGGHTRPLARTPAQPSAGSIPAEVQRLLEQVEAFTGSFHAPGAIYARLPYELRIN